MAVIGAGWIGAEVAASARQKGLDVTLIEQLDVPLERVLGREVGGIYARSIATRASSSGPGQAVEAIEGAGRVERSGSPAATPSNATSWWSASASRRVPSSPSRRALGRQRDRHDERLETSADGIFAAGDVANAWHPFFEQGCA